MASPKEKRIKKIDEILSNLRKNPEKNEFTIESYEGEKEDLLGRIDKSAKVQAIKGPAAETGQSRKRITKTGMTDGETLAIATILGASGPGAVLKAISAVKALPSTAKLLSQLAKLGGKRAKEAYKELKSALKIVTGKGKPTNLPAAGGRGKVLVRDRSGRLSGAVSPRVAKFAEGAGKVARSPTARVAAGASVAATIALALQKEKNKKLEEARIDEALKKPLTKVTIDKILDPKPLKEKREKKAAKARKIPAGIKSQDADIGGQKYAKASKKDKRDAFTKKMEKLLGLNRSSAQIMEDMEVSRELDKDLLKKGGKVKSTKKYVMNRGGKVASVRKPTRA